MSRRISITPKSTNLEPGRPMPVLVQAHFDKPTKIRGIKATFYGAERTEADYTESYTDSDGKHKTRTRTAVEFVRIVDKQFVLFGSPSESAFQGATRLVASMFGGGSSEVVSAGTHEFEVFLELPDDAPASFKARKCSVFYRLDVQIDVPLWPDPKLDHEFVVLPIATPFQKSKPVLFTHPDPERGRGFWDKAFGKDVTFDVAFETNVFQAGEDVSGMLTIKTPDRVNLDEVQFSLLATETTKAEGHTDSSIHNFKVSSIKMSHPITQQFDHEFSLSVPDCGLSTSQGKNFRIDYQLEVRLDVPWAKDPVIRIPVEYFNN